MSITGGLRTLAIYQCGTITDSPEPRSGRK
jgi:hypothetical protein